MQRGGDEIAVLAQHLDTDGQRTLIELLRPRQVAFLAIGFTQVVQQCREGGAVAFLNPFHDRDGAAIELFLAGIVARVVAEIGHRHQAAHVPQAVRPERLLDRVERLPQQRVGLGALAHVLVQLPEPGSDYRSGGLVGAERVVHDRQRPHVQRFRPGVVGQPPVDTGELRRHRSGLQIVAAALVFDDVQRALEQRARSVESAFAVQSRGGHPQRA